MANSISVPTAHHDSRSVAAKPIRPTIYYRSGPEAPDRKTKRIRSELIRAGATPYGLLKAESRYLPKVLHDGEHVEAVIYGQHISSSAMLAATDERIIYLDKKPMVEVFDELSYEVISGIEFDIHTFFATIVLHTPVKNYDFKCVNLRCAEKFARHIEKHRLKREPKETVPAEILPRARPASLGLGDSRGLDALAGYYWLPGDEEERQRIR